jgi:hypothetical protein
VREIQSGRGVVRFAGDVKEWPPSVGVARPGACPWCEGPAFSGLGKVMLHGHGVVKRVQRGPASVETSPIARGVPVRVYLCQYAECGKACRVLPSSAVPRKHFSGAAIGLALALWGLVGLSAPTVRSRINERLTFEPGWPALARWAGDIVAGRLFAGLEFSSAEGKPRALAGRVALALCGWAPAAVREGQREHQAFAGACHVR